MKDDRAWSIWESSFPLSSPCGIARGLVPNRADRAGRRAIPQHGPPGPRPAGGGLPVIHPHPEPVATPLRKPLQSRRHPVRLRLRLPRAAARVVGSRRASVVLRAGRRPGTHTGSRSGFHEKKAKALETRRTGTARRPVQCVAGRSSGPRYPWRLPGNPGASLPLRDEKVPRRCREAGYPDRP